MSKLHRGLAALAAGSLTLVLVGPAVADEDPTPPDGTEAEPGEEAEVDEGVEPSALEVMVGNVEAAAAQAGADAEAVLAALAFKCDVLWAQLDALWGAYVAGAVPPGAWRPGDSTSTDLPGRAA